jgi:hypothetical protein
MSNFVILIIVRKSVINMEIKIFNGLPLELKSIENFKVFKNKLKNYLIHNEFYSLHMSNFVILIIVRKV